MPANGRRKTQNAFLCAVPGELELASHDQRLIGALPFCEEHAGCLVLPGLGFGETGSSDYSKILVSRFTAKRGV
jgi:hypothetical protein